MLAHAQALPVVLAYARQIDWNVFWSVMLVFGILWLLGMVLRPFLRRNDPKGSSSHLPPQDFTSEDAFWERVRREEEAASNQAKDAPASGDQPDNPAS